MIIASLKRSIRVAAARIIKIQEFIYFTYCRLCICRKRSLGTNLTQRIDEFIQDDSGLYPKLFSDIAPHSLSFYSSHFPHQVNTTIEYAEDVTKHVFDLLGSGPHQLNNGKNINWHADFKTGYQWSAKKFFRFIKLKESSGDIKIPWELSRFQSQLCLAQAFLLTKDEKYAIEFQQQVLDWIKKNPVGFGVNWKSNMDIAIRVVNWLVIFELFKVSYQFPEEFLSIFFRSVYDHGQFIAKHFHNIDGVTSNHYLSEIAGLLFISILCPFYKQSLSWRQYAVRELEKEVDIQVYPDGTDYEASTSYHRLVLEILLYSLILGAKNSVQFSNHFIDTVKKMCQATFDYLKPNGHAPQIGDNDSGQFIKFFQRESLDQNYILAIAAIMFNDPGLKFGNQCPPEVFWLFGQAGFEKWRTFENRQVMNLIHSYHDAGWYIVKDSLNSLFVSCGKNGKNGLGGHGHNDKLSFELYLQGFDIIVDPGSFVYMPDPEKRNLFRSTRYHNTVYFEKIEQNDLSKGLFYLQDTIQYGEKKLERIGPTYVFAGEIAYSNVWHKRQITVRQDFAEIEIQDLFSATGTSVAYVFYHLSPMLLVEHQDIVTRNGIKIARITIENIQMNKKIYQYSAGYGILNDAIVLEAHLPITGARQCLITRIEKY